MSPGLGCQQRRSDPAEIKLDRHSPRKKTISETSCLSPTILAMQCGGVAGDHHAVILRPDHDASDFWALLAKLRVPDANARSIAFFLASTDRCFKPYLIFVRRQHNYVGLVCAKERLLYGIATGIAYIDLSVNRAVFAPPERSEEVLAVAVRALFIERKIRALRLLAREGAWNGRSIRQVAQSCSLDYEQAILHRHPVLTLASTYEGFLRSIDYNTRRHLRRYRRRFEIEQHEYLEALSLPEFVHAGRELMKQKVIGAVPHKLERAAKMFSLAEAPLLAALRAKDGTWLSVVGGWKKEGAAIIFFQLNNDRQYARYSLASVMRGYLIESLISKGVTKIIFWGSVSDPLRRACEPLPTTCVYLDRSSMLWYWFRKELRRFAHLLRRELVQWVVPLPYPKPGVAKTERCK